MKKNIFEISLWNLFGCGILPVKQPDHEKIYLFPVSSISPADITT